jgi:carbon-monoxide dehydrogenase medium subunit
VTSVKTRVHFDYVAPRSLEAALLELRRSPEAAIIAGGTDLLPRWRSGLIQPSLMIDFKHLGLSYIKAEENKVCIGAYTTHSQMIASELLTGYFPALSEACRQIAAPPIRNRGTLGGNLVNASPAADTAPPLMAYDAELVLVKAGSQRVVSLDKFFIGPGKTRKQPDELLAEVYLPFCEPNTASKFIKMGNRRAMAIAVASVAVRISLGDAGEIQAARIALGSVAPTPMRAREAESMLVGEKLSDDVISAAAHMAQGEVTPISDIRASKEYRRRMVEVLVKRSLLAARTELRERMPGA